MSELAYCPIALLGFERDCKLFDLWYSIIDWDLPLPMGSGTEHGTVTPNCNKKTAKIRKAEFTDKKILNTKKAFNGS